jgi:hypothetical protein
MTDDPHAQTEVLLRRTLTPVLQDAQEVPEAIVHGAMRRGRRRRQARRTGIALIPLVTAAAVAATAMALHLSMPSQDHAPTDTTPMRAWRSAAESPLSPRTNPTMVQVGHDVVVLGGSDADPCGPSAACAFSPEGERHDGAVYEPDRDVWRTIAPSPVALGSISATASVNAVYVLTRPRTSLGQAQQFWEYSLTDDRWTRLPAPSQRMDSLISAGADRLIAYVYAHPKAGIPDQSYDITSRTWSPMPRDPLAPSQDRNLIATDAGNLVLIAVNHQARPGKPLWRPWRTAQWNAATNTWKEIPTPTIVDSDPRWWPTAGQIVNASTQSAKQGKRIVGTGGILDPVAGTWQTVPDSPFPGTTENGYRLLQTGGSGKVFVNGQLLDVRSRTWTQAPRAPARFPTQDAAAVIVDDRMIVFGGATFDSDRGKLINDTWILRLPATTAATS